MLIVVGDNSRKKKERKNGTFLNMDVVWSLDCSVGEESSNWLGNDGGAGAESGGNGARRPSRCVEAAATVPSVESNKGATWVSTQALPAQSPGHGRPRQVLTQRGGL